MWNHVNEWSFETKQPFISANIIQFMYWPRKVQVTVFKSPIPWFQPFYRVILDIKMELICTTFQILEWCRITFQHICQVLGVLQIGLEYITTKWHNKYNEYAFVEDKYELTELYIS